MNLINNGYIGLLASVGAFSVAISTMVGRIYALEYSRALGIPISDFGHDLTDYPLMSPDATIYGLGICIVTLILVWWRSQSERSTTWRAMVSEALIIAAFGTIATIISVWFLLLKEFWPGSSGIWWTLLVAPFLFWGAYAVPSSPLILPNAMNSEFISLARLFSAIVTLSGLVGITLILTMMPSAIAKLDAGRVLRDAPQAIVEFTSSTGRESLQDGSEVQGGNPSTPNFRVILIGEKFVYLRPTSPEGRPSKSALYAIPTRDIVSITYVSSDNNQ